MCSVNRNEETGILFEINEPLGQYFLGCENMLSKLRETISNDTAQ
jgi:hypothetical protein